jgi:squalene-hopene/tetraprenyl-beta-curcumene cyclase
MMKHASLLALLLSLACGKTDDVEPAPGGSTSENAGKTSTQNPAPAAPAKLDRAATQAALDKGLAWLRSQAKDGLYMVDVGGGQKFPSPAHTAFALTPVARSVPKADRATDPFLLAGQKFLLSLQQEDGHIAAHDDKFNNYYTCATLMTLATIDDPATQKARERMGAYIKSIQRLEEGRVQGGFGYNTAKSADLSNTQYAIEALRAAGVPENDPELQKALKYLERTQNRSENEANKGAKYEVKGKTIVPGNDGSAGYEPGVSKAGMRRMPDGTYAPRGYGSMTYALLKCYILVGLDKDDARVQSTLKWLGENYTWSENPGFDQTVRESDHEQAAQARFWGLYYYYTTAAKALNLLGQEMLDTPDGPRSWRADMASAIVSRQGANGSWVNDKSARWEEDDPVLVTAYALIALQEILAVE